MQLTEKQIETAMHKWIDNCDADEFARLAGEMFGGKCLFSPEQPSGLEFGTIYDFEPNENYFGEFDGE